MGSLDYRAIAERINGLAPRQRELLEHIVEGLEREEIAKRMKLPLRTLRNYTARLYLELSLKGRMDSPVQRHQILSESLRVFHELYKGGEEKKVIGENGEDSRFTPMLSGQGGNNGAVKDHLTAIGGAVELLLSDSETILGIEIFRNLDSLDGGVEKIAEFALKGFQPERLVIYPTANPNVSLTYTVFIKRKKSS